MSSQFSVSDDVKELINDIVLKNRWDPIEITYNPTTQPGDGFSCKHVSVDVITKDETFRLFVKHIPNVPNMDAVIVEALKIEPFFYNTVYPTYASFLQQKRVENGFTKVPKCYGTSSKHAIALENLKARGFALCNRKKPLNNKHILLALKAFAKFHAISFAFKDQEREKYEKLTANTIQDFMMSQSKGKDSPPMKMLKGLMSESLNKLDPKTDKHILEKVNVDDAVRPLAEVKSYLNEYSILLQGDSWCNNMMFLYENDDEKENPLDVMLIDWQRVRPGSPVFDVSYFFYSVAGLDALSKLDFYLKEYYTELAQQIRDLGSDPDRLYPLSVFENEWKTHCRYGFSMAFMLVKFMLATTDEVPKLAEVELEELGTTNFFPTFNQEVEYSKRMRDLCEFMVNKNYL